MAVEKIPEQVRFKCDACGNIESVAPHSRPRHWAKLILQRDCYDWQGIAVADGTVTRDLCGGCHECMEKAINEAFKKIGGGAT